MIEYKIAKKQMERIFLDNFAEGYVDTRWFFPINLIILGIYTFFVSFLFLIFIPFFMLLGENEK